jgi:DNA modification methylase
MADLSLWRNRERSNQGKLTDKYLQPPFSILDSRKRDWQDRKREWLNLGIKPELGRASGLTYNIDKTTSIFDPVLCELVYRWFLPDNGSVLDPFAGGSVRGIVASILGHKYVGIELSKEQVEANYEQADHILDKTMIKPQWIVGDANDIDKLVSEEFDLIFTCPPYYNLEIYSDDPKDLSNLATYEEFITIYDSIFKSALRYLKNDRFAVITIQDIRDSKGFYCGLENDTEAILTKHGARAYNQMVLVNMSGSAAFRAEKSFESSRKITKTHQSVVCHLKGNPPRNWDSSRDTEVIKPQQVGLW